MQKQALNTRDFEAAREEKAADRGTRIKEGELNRASRQEIAGIQADSRMAVEESRAQGRQARLQAIHGMGPKVFSEYMKSFNAHRAKLTEGAIISGKKPEQIEAEAHDSAWNAVQRGLGADKGGTEPGTQRPLSNEAGERKKVEEDEKKRKSGLTWEQVTKVPGYDTKLATPEGRKQFLEEYPHLGNDLYRWEAKRKIPGYGGMFGGGR
jgi:hypothetical protein